MLSLNLAGSIANIKTILISTAIVVGNVYLFYINNKQILQNNNFSGREGNEI